MESQISIVEKLERIMKSVFEDDNLTITKDTVSSDIDNWDSLNHIQLMVEIQNEFGINLTALEMQKFRNVGDICSCLLKK